MRNERNRLLYRMIFATDSEPGNKVMSHVYDRAVDEFPAMAEEARATRAYLALDEKKASVISLFEGTEFDTPALRPRVRSNKGLYVHLPPEEPRMHEADTCQHCV